MLAAFGFPVAEHFHPLFGGNIDVPSCVEINQCVAFLRSTKPTPEAGRCGNLAAPVLEKSAKLGGFGILCILASRSMNHC
jgi:hypothetical protein